MSDERRETTRRQEDKKRVGVLIELIPILRGAVLQLRHLAWGAILILAIVSSVAAIALTIALVRSTDVTAKATLAATKATTALKDVNAAEQLLHRQLLQSCIRLNIERAKSNLSNLGDFYVDKVVLRNANLIQQRVLGALLEPNLKFAVRTKTWTPLTNCTAAVAANGASYRPAKPIRFINRLAPPLALNLENATRPTPSASLP